ncbi:MAG: HI0074 family nucleotidyltransferase substrate-binding subunit [Lachnospiraceae bacterium]|nr:HI0074 family nucleotidyltransferase substrate-binding subunit [Lachnospiraceae bacterium]
MKRYEQFSSHLDVLKKANEEDLDNTFIVSGIIDKFFIQFELGWKLFKDLLRYEGRSEAATGSPREVIKGAYKVYDFMSEELWLEMLAERNNSAHLYDEEAAKTLVRHILEDYIDVFETTKKSLIKKYGEDFLLKD